MGRELLATSMVDYQRWRPQLAELLDTRFHTIDWLDREVLYGRLKLFSDEKSAIVVSIKTYPTGAKECHVEAAAGELAHLIGPAISRVEQWAANQGCVTVTIQSREGWQKVMKTQGYELHQTAIRKEL